MALSPKVKKLVVAFGKYMIASKLGSGADIKIQQRLYKNFLRELERTQKVTGIIDMDILRRASEKWISEKSFKGPGVDW